MTKTNTQIATQTVGEGPRKLVVLHGLMGRGKNFATAAKAWGDAFTTTLVDLPNHGQSAWTQNFSYTDMAEAVAGVLAELGSAGAPVDLLGHSMGGKTAMVLALRHPDLVRRLVVEDISPAAVRDSTEFVHLLGSLRTLDLGSLRSRTQADEELRERIPNPRVRGFLLQNLRAHNGGFVWQPNLELLYESLDKVGGFPYGPQADADFPEDAHRISPFAGPVLWMGGADSHYVRGEHEEAMSELFPRVRRTTVKNAGHWIHSDQPDVFAELVRSFLTR